MTEVLKDIKKKRRITDPINCRKEHSIPAAFPYKPVINRICRDELDSRQEQKEKLIHKEQKRKFQREASVRRVERICSTSYIRRNRSTSVIGNQRSNLSFTNLSGHFSPFNCCDIVTSGHNTNSYEAAEQLNKMTFALGNHHHFASVLQ